MVSYLKPFLMDEGKDFFVVFILEQENKANAYIWVKLDDQFDPHRDIRITNFYGLCSYGTHTTDPFYVSNEFPEEAVRLAKVRLATCPKSILRKYMKEFKQDIKRKRSHEEGIKEYFEWEREALSLAKQVAESGGGTIYI